MQTGLHIILLAGLSPPYLVNHFHLYSVVVVSISNLNPLKPFPLVSAFGHFLFLLLVLLCISPEKGIMMMMMMMMMMMI
jgi:hypothetical protein